MSAERMAEIERYVAEWEAFHRTGDLRIPNALQHFRWLLDRVRELEGTAEDVAWLRRMEFTTLDRVEAEAHHAWFQSFLARMAARSPSGEGQP